MSVAVLLLAQTDLKKRPVPVPCGSKQAVSSGRTQALSVAAGCQCRPPPRRRRRSSLRSSPYHSTALTILFSQPSI